MEGNRTPKLLEIIVVSARGLKDVNFFAKMGVYAVVSIDGDHRTKRRTPVVKACGSNPNWNYGMTFPVNRDAVYLLIELKSHRMLGDRDIGTVQFHIDRNGEAESEHHVSCNVLLPNGKAKGTLKFSYKFGEMFNGTPVQQPEAMDLDEHGENPAMANPGPTQGYPTPPVQTPQRPWGGFVQQMLRAVCIAIVGETAEQIYDQYGADC